MKVLVTTPNGKVGQEVVRQLQERGVEVRVGAHTVDKARQAFPGAEVVPFDYADEASVREALRGVDALYLASPGDMPAEPVKRVVDLAREAGVGQIVRLSAMGAQHSDNPLREVERHIEASGAHWTFLRPSWFMQNYSTMYADMLRGGALYEPAGDGKTSFVDARDIAAVAVAALTGEGHAGQAYTITGPQALDRDEVAAAISGATGRDVRYVPISDEQLQETMRAGGAPEAYVGLMSALYGAVRGGHSAEVTDDVRRVTGRDPIPFTQFARDHADVWAGELKEA
ncbi:NmrA family transcriptional regulator [Deinococcus aetherius]|uniref:NmrA family transcriptional regulator n=1 Tax=Deinococcus aetherius TaxID=200252 RepID=A0ABM8AG62_9DEIO|nr:SDR family oxidoreductase [Deinococcus aetherius]BDP42785.1 NmrA family transcriptional regulator [Deinococcus aetherius]